MGPGLATEPRRLRVRLSIKTSLRRACMRPASDRRHPLVEVEPVVDELLDLPRPIACGLSVELKEGLNIADGVRWRRDTALRDPGSSERHCDARRPSDRRSRQRWRDVAFLVQRQDGVDDRLPVAVATSAAPVDAGELPNSSVPRRHVEPDREGSFGILDRLAGGHDDLSASVTSKNQASAARPAGAARRRVPSLPLVVRADVVHERDRVLARNVGVFHGVPAAIDSSAAMAPRCHRPRRSARLAWHPAWRTALGLAETSEFLHGSRCLGVEGRWDRQLIGVSSASMTSG